MTMNDGEPMKLQQVLTAEVETFEQTKLAFQPRENKVLSSTNSSLYHNDSPQMANPTDAKLMRVSS